MRGASAGGAEGEGHGKGNTVCYKKRQALVNCQRLNTFPVKIIESFCANVSYYSRLSFNVQKS